LQTRLWRFSSAINREIDELKEKENVTVVPLNRGLLPTPRGILLGIVALSEVLRLSPF